MNLHMKIKQADAKIKHHLWDSYKPSQNDIYFVI